MKNTHAVIGSAICFGLPILIVTILNWDQIQPYVVVDPANAAGHVVYLYTPG